MVGLKGQTHKLAVCVWMRVCVNVRWFVCDGAHYSDCEEGTETGYDAGRTR